jgi:hypothetical protein
MKKDPTGLLETEQNRLEPDADSHRQVQSESSEGLEEMRPVAEQVRSLRMTTLPGKTVQFDHFRPILFGNLNALVLCEL